jgi:hypothetical protein
MDGGEDRLPGFLPKQRARVLPEGVLPAHDLGPDDPYLREGDRPSPADAEVALRAPAEAKVRVRKIILKGSVCSSFPAYRRQKSLVAQRRQKTTEMSAQHWLQAYVKDARLVQDRTMLHKCGPSCWKYSKEGQRLCRHQVYHLVDFEPDTEEKPKRLRRDGRRLNQTVRIVEEDTAGQRGRLDLIREHPTETTTNYPGAVCLRSNLDNQSLVRVLPLSILDSGPLPTIGRRPHWASMGEEMSEDCNTSLLLPPSGTQADQDPYVATAIQVSCEVDTLMEEMQRETAYLFQDAHNAGFYINEYTTKLAVLGDKLLPGLRRAAEKQQQEMELAAEKMTQAKKTLNGLRKIVHLIARLQVQSGSEMAFPMLFGHMSFCTHRTWEVNVRRPTALAWKSWEKCHGKSVQRLHDSPTFRHSLNIYLPQEQGVELSRDWLVLELPSDKLGSTPQFVLCHQRACGLILWRLRPSTSPGRARPWLLPTRRPPWTPTATLSGSPTFP